MRRLLNESAVEAPGPDLQYRLVRLARGDRLGPYEIVAPLGAGAMGEVYRARDPRLDRFVAIKLLTGAVGRDARAQLRREARAAAALNHPHVCTIFEIADAGKRLFIVMEQVEGRPLSDLVSEGVPIDAVVRYGAQIADALAHAHDRGVVHRDLKSANLMVTADGRVKVLDFGIAALTGEAAAHAATRAATAPGTLSGTPAYMAPEVLKGAAADRRSDIWAIGVVLYEMVTGRRPFGGETSFEITSSILRDQPDPLERRVPAPLRAVIARCLAKDPALRYQQAGEVRAALEATATLATPAKATREPRREGTSKSRRATASRIRAIAVLPLDNLSRDPEQEYFADGITEALISAVAQIEGLRVISRASIMRFKGTTKSVPEIARELNVNGIIGGSVRRAGDRVRISAQLIDATTDAHTWSATYDRDLHDILALEREIGQAVADEIALKVEGRSRAETRAAAVDPATYSLYLQGRHAWHQLNPPALERAIDWFQQAIARDASYAPARVGLADATYFLALFESISPREAYDRGAGAAQKGLELDPTLPEAHAAVANFKFLYEWDWAGAERAYRRAIELNPHASLARWHYSTFLGNMGRPDDAVAQVAAVRDVDPLWPGIHQNLAYWSFIAGRRDESRIHHQMTWDLDANYAVALWTFGMLDLDEGRHDDALARFRRAMDLTGGAPFFASGVAVACAASDRRGEARQILDGLERRAQTNYVSRASMAWIHAALGDVDAAVQCARIGFEQRDSMMLSIATCPWWDPIRHTDAFEEIVLRMKFPGAGAPGAGRGPELRPRR